MKTKFIFVTGGVLSSLGKGLAAASLGALLKARGLSVTVQKLDPYLNIDPGTLNPLEHGEVFVTDDGAEADLDLGHYERYLDVSLSQFNTTTSGRIYYRVLNNERNGAYKGGTVQVIPHITDEIKRTVRRIGEQENAPDVAIVEIGGTVGDIEGLPFLEAIRQLRFELGRNHCLNIHLSYVPYIAVAGEYKTKPTQHSTKALLALGIQPDIILCRCEQPMPADIKRKIALFCNVDQDAVFSSVDVKNVYEVPLKFYEEGFDLKVAMLLSLPARRALLDGWRQLMADFEESSKRKITIGIVGKYVDLPEAYKSLREALVHAGVANLTSLDLRYVNSEEVNAKTAADLLGGCDGILVPDGFGYRGVEGKIEAIRYARENKVPFFGLSLGMQCAVIEFARNVAGLDHANSEEFAPENDQNVIYTMEGIEYRQKAKEFQNETSDKSDQFRLGAYPCVIVPGTLAAEAYQQEEVSERHRHSYEFNNAFRDLLAEKGLIISGTSPDGNLVEIVELADHPWFLGCQFAPQFKSRPMKAHPIIKSFIAAALKKSGK
ncbi:MAG: CTP synthase [Mailhella sp.]|nr:CTP synthase [Mailhella sp.]